MPRHVKYGGPESIHVPTRERQAERLAPRLTTLLETFQARRAQVRAEATGILPEEVLVLETIGPIDDFITAVRRISGMEWLGEIEEDDIPPDDDFFSLDTKGKKKEKILRGRIFLVFTNQRALEQMLSLWRLWKEGKPLAKEFSKWNKVFELLRDIRPWGVNDRLAETGVLSDWRERIDHGKEVVPCEIELWYRRSATTRESAEERVRELVREQGGRILRAAIIEEINYHALLAELPIAAIEVILRGQYEDVALIQSEKIQFFRATGQMAALVPESARITDNSVHDYRPRGNPIIALLDGLPLQNHRLLARHLIIDDPDDYTAIYQAQERRHGTAMASLIINGELDSPGPPLSRPLYVRPILQPDVRDWRTPREETVPENVLIVDLIHRAVRRLFEGEGEEPPVAEDVCIINLSIGIRDRLFDGSLSPLARLLDWLAWKYKVLFFVSAGNHPHKVELDLERESISRIPRAEVQRLVLQQIAAQARHRRLLSPAEAVNVLTVGATHEDLSGGNVPRAIDPYVDAPVPSPINAQGMGYRRAIKPEVLAPGGRVIFMEEFGAGDKTVLGVFVGSVPPGQRVAAPGRTLGETSASWHTRGTSNATALMSRAAGILYDVLQELRDQPGGELIASIPVAIWLKALIVHAADWGNAGAILGRILRTDSNNRQFKEYVTRLLGFGVVDETRVAECTAYRVTALGGGVLREELSHLHRYPLPPSLSGKRGRRRLTITLAWLTPTNPYHQAYRSADLWFSPPTKTLCTDRRQADGRAVRRGTVQHEILEGERAVVFVDGDNLEIQVNCRADAGSLEEPIPYSLAVTLEVDEKMGVPIYEEVHARVHAARIVVTPA